MKKLEKYIVRNWIWLVAGLILTRKAVEFAYAERGYVTFGGEWLVLPVILMVVHMVRNLRRTLFVKNGFFEEVDADDRSISRDHHRMAE